MNDNIRKYLNEEYLAWVIIDSLSQPKVVSIMSKLGIEYPGMRINSLPIQDLAYDLSDEAFEHDDIMRIIEKTLDEANASTKSIISRMNKDEIKRLIDDKDRLYALGRPGHIIWALVSDPRPEISALTDGFLDFIEDQVEKNKNHSNKAKEDHLTEIVERLASKTGNRELLKIFNNLKKEAKENDRILSRLELNKNRLEEKNLRQHELILQLRKELGELVQEKGRSAKQLVLKEETIMRISRELEELKKQPKTRLKSELHHLEKENDKLKYILEKQAKENNLKIQELEKGCLDLKNNLASLKDINLNLSRQLEEERNSKLVQDSQPRQLVAKETHFPKEKGKRLGIFIDCQNVYYSAKKHFNKKLDYLLLLADIVKDRHLVKAICYLVQQYEGELEGFISMLKNNGYVVRTRDLIRRADGSAKGNWDIGIAVDVMTMVDKNSLDIVTLVTCDGDFSDLAKFLVAKGIRVEIVGFTMNMAMDLKKTASEYSFINEDLMRKE